MKKQELNTILTGRPSTKQQKKKKQSKQRGEKRDSLLTKIQEVTNEKQQLWKLFFFWKIIRKFATNQIKFSLNC